MSHLPPFDATAVPTATRWVEAVGYCDVRKLNVSTSLSANFTQPAVGSTVTVTVGSSTAFVVGDTVAVSGALSTYRGGVYCVAAKPTATTMTLQLLVRGFIAPGSVVASGADVRSVSPILVTPTDRGQLVVTDLYCDSLVCPGFGDTTRPTISIGWNRGGTPFSEFYSAQQLNFTPTRSSGQMAASTALTFAQPAIGASVSIKLAAPAAYSLGTWGFPLDTTVEVLRSGVYRVAGFVTTTTTAAFSQPVLNASVTINVASTVDYAVGDFVWSSTPTIPAVGVYEITAKTTTSLTVAARNAGLSFETTVTVGTSIPIGSTIWHAQTLQVQLLRDSRPAAGQTVPAGLSVIRYWPDAATTAAPFVIAGIGNSTVFVDDNRQFTVGTSVIVNVSPTSCAGIYTVIQKRGLDRLDIDIATFVDYSPAGVTVPAGASVIPWRQSGQVLPLRGSGTTRLSVDPGSVIAAYVSVSGNATAADVVAIHLRGYHVS